MRRGVKCSWLTVLIPILLAGHTALAAQPDQPTNAGGLPSSAEIKSILHELSDITGFRIRKELPFAMITRDQVNEYLKDQIRRTVKPEEIRAEETTLKKFGFAPPDFDLKKTTIDLLTEQAAAFYDFHRKKLFISDWATTNMREVALVHELAHALADQNFPIEKFSSKGADSSEVSLAREAVVEGQASWLMIEVGARRAGRTLADPQTARELLETDNASPSSDYPVFNNAPLYLRRTLMFPYDDGEKFQQAVFLRKGKPAFADVFRDPPSTTAQIIHPPRYFEHSPLANPDLPKPIAHAKPFVSGAMGELETRILLEQYIGADVAEALGPRLKGSDYRLDRIKAENRTTLVYVSEWSDEDSAAQYFGAYQRVLRAKWKSMEVTGQSPTAFTGKSEDGYFSVRREGTKVVSEEGFERPLR
jgi:hypothetical protein